MHLALLALLVAPAANAESGKCASQIRKAQTAKGEALVEAYQSVIACDGAAAASAFPDFMRASGDSDTLVGLSLAAIDAGQNAPVWEMAGQIKDYSQRGTVVRAVGAACGEHGKVVDFLTTGYDELSSVAFDKWKPALETCSSEALTSWMSRAVQTPPSIAYDEKYDAVLQAYVKHQGAASLDAIKAGAIIAGKKGGPFTALLEAAGASIQPATYGGTVSDEDKKAFADALSAVAKGVGPENAKLVADRLYTSGFEAEAASLLPRVYPDATKGGRLSYGVAGVETCDGETILHVAEATDPAKRWSIMADVEPQVRAFKPKLKCDSGEWAVLSTPEPLQGKGAFDTWVGELETTYAAKGSVKLKEEKAIALD
ncbi:MAG: hypothetical protein EP330_22540 [Deltaproteobacteria bacterium]|nr:MAG: hypothetical protein EP330_22540 [Deltaproteobacteria bacterium]